MTDPHPPSNPLPPPARDPAPPVPARLSEAQAAPPGWPWWSGLLVALVCFAVLHAATLVLAPSVGAEGSRSALAVAKAWAHEVLSLLRVAVPVLALGVAAVMAWRQRRSMRREARGEPRPARDTGSTGHDPQSGC